MLDPDQITELTKLKGRIAETAYAPRASAAEGSGEREGRC